MAFKGQHLKRVVIISLTVIFTGLVNGCAHWTAPHIPEGWQAVELDKKINLNDIKQPRLQIIIMSGDVFCNHTALRLVSPDQPVIFWDPGGGFGDSEESTEYFSGKGKNGSDLVIKRYYDLVLSEPENLTRYMDYRWRATNDRMVEIFEYNLTDEQARKLNNALLNGANNFHQKDRFYTDAEPLRCSVAISDFLQRFMNNRINLPEKYFFPHNLSRQLYMQSPDQVLIFRRKQKPVLYKYPASR